MTTEDVNRTIAFMNGILERLDDDTELAEELSASIEQRVLTEQPKETPKQRYERLFGGNGEVRG